MTATWVSLDLIYPMIRLHEDPDAGHVISMGKVMHLGDGLAIISTGRTYGPTEIGAEVLDSAPPVELSPWEAVEQASINLSHNSEFAIVSMSDSSEIGLTPVAFDSVTPLTAGLYGIRVSVRGRGEHSRDVACLIQLWPITEKIPLQNLKDEDGVDVNDLYQMGTDPHPKG
ncbi:hypothetical protein [Rhodococcus sp. (in: high G+C Gram-positive bacteria)]|uniref:hypothetical protein n=1 Tax=Rhodococcus sp. TaxID=1831 RepID=UPI0025801369|nr:hypothetical protein [Rhodococcus sp. (in: high G+C Gram-positive bacteria)]MBQ7805008.1 hypothetical protein [Rhodococcus sp. (in: high G+C Gram-positive bacteria)]